MFSRVSAKSFARVKIRVKTVAAIAAVALCLSIGLNISVGRAEEFLSVLDDMPLAPGLTELTDRAADFDTPAGRIVDAVAQGKAAPKTIATFYDKTLPALGWVREGSGRFIRDNERLTIAVTSSANKGLVTARFSLRPRDGK